MREVEPVPDDAMGLRLELFVDDMDRAIAFYGEVLGFTLLRREEGYASVRRDGVTLGLGPIAKLPDVGGYFTRPRLAKGKGLGVEIVLEVEDLEAELARVEAAGWPLVEGLRERPWGLADFRIADPDGYYLRITTIPREGDPA